MPIPESATVKRTITRPAVARPGTSAMSTRTSPSSVNLMALLTRFTSTCRSCGMSPTRYGGTSGAISTT